MDDAAIQTSGERVAALKAESKRLDTELFAAFQKKVAANEERRLEDGNIRRARERQDELLAADRRKEDATRALKRLSDDEEHDRHKMSIMRKQIELESTIQTIAGRSPSADRNSQAPTEELRQKNIKLEAGTEQHGPSVSAPPLWDGSRQCFITGPPHGPTLPPPIAKVAIAMNRNVSENRGRPVHPETSMATPAPAPSGPLSERRWDASNTEASLIGEMKQIGVGGQPTLSQSSLVASSELMNPSFKAPSMPFSMRDGQQQREEGYARQDGVHPSRAALHSQTLTENSSSFPSGNNGLHIGNSQQQPATTNNFSADGWLDTMVCSERKRKASSSSPPDYYSSSPQPPQKRFASGPNSLANRVAKERALLSTHQPGANIKTAPAPLRLSDIAVARKQTYSTAGILFADLRRMLGCIKHTQICLPQRQTRLEQQRSPPVMIMNKWDQVHAPVAEGVSDGVYYTLLDPLQVRGPFAVLVSTAIGGGVYQYMGNYVIDNTRVLRDAEVERLGKLACIDLVRGAMMRVTASGKEELRMEFVEPLLRDGVVRTEKEAVKTNSEDYVRRMKHIKLTRTFSGKPTRKMNVFAHHLVFRGFERDFFPKYIEKHLV